MTQQEQAVPQSTSIVQKEAGAAILATREQAELQGQIYMAKNYQRDEALVLTKVLNTCMRPSFAERATYSYTRGKGEKEVLISGPSIKLALELQRCWGNMESGVKIMSIEG